MTSLSHEDFSKVTVKSQLTLDSQCYLAPAQRAFCANYSLATTILTNFPEAAGRYLVNRILFTAQWEIISIKQVTRPDTSDLMDGWWQWKIISKCHWVVLPYLHSSDIDFLHTQPISQTGRETLRALLVRLILHVAVRQHTNSSHAFYNSICSPDTFWNTRVSANAAYAAPSALLKYLYKATMQTIKKSLKLARLAECVRICYGQPS